MLALGSVVLGYYSTVDRECLVTESVPEPGPAAVGVSAPTAASGYVDEVFVSVQGEGVWVGVRQVFVRLSGCSLDCAYCDSPRSRRLTPAMLVHSAVPSEAEPIENPVPHGMLTTIIARLARGARLHSVAVTGGEPLLQSRFLAAWLPALRRRGCRVYLETAGYLPDRLASVAHLVDHCAMDVKLPSSAGTPPLWERHRRFLEICRDHGIRTCVKAVVCGSTFRHEVAACAELIRDAWPDVSLVLQPCTPAHRVLDAPGPSLLLDLQAVALKHLRDVRVIPQAHKLMGAR